MKKLLGALFIAIVMIALVGCNNDVSSSSDTAIADLKLAIKIDGEDKALDYSGHYAAGFAIASYEYKATCTTTAGARGTQASWASLDVSNGSATLSGLARGTWTIDVRAKNSTGGVILQAQVAGVVLQSNGQTQAINLKNTNGATSATVSIGVTVPTLANGSVTVKYTSLANISSLASGTAVSMTGTANKSTTVSGTSIVATTTSTGNTAYTGSVSLAPGLYVMQVQYLDNSTAVAGQIMAFRVTDNTPFAINGTLTAGEFLDLQLNSITTDDRVIDVQLTDAAVSNGTLTCTATATVTSGTLTSPVYHWYVDGVLVADQTTNAFSKSGYDNTSGTHVLTCIVNGTVNGESVIGYNSSEYIVQLSISVSFVDYEDATFGLTYLKFSVLGDDNIAYIWVPITINSDGTIISISSGNNWWIKYNDGPSDNDLSFANLPPALADNNIQITSQELLWCDSTDAYFAFDLYYLGNSYHFDYARFLW